MQQAEPSAQAHEGCGWPWLPQHGAPDHQGECVDQGQGQGQGFLSGPPQLPPPPQMQLPAQMQPQHLPLQMSPQMQMQPQMQSQMQPQMQSQLQQQLTAQMQTQMQQQQLSPQMQPQMQPQMSAQMEPQVQTHLRAQMQPQLTTQMHSQMHPQLTTQMHSQMHPQLTTRMHSRMQPQQTSQMQAQMTQMQPQMTPDLMSAPFAVCPPQRAFAAAKLGLPERAIRSEGHAAMSRAGLQMSESVPMDCTDLFGAQPTGLQVGMLGGGGGWAGLQEAPGLGPHCDGQPQDAEPCNAPGSGYADPEGEASGDASALGGGRMDLEALESSKRERRRAMNRVAASRCRRRKLDRIEQLESRLRALSSEHLGLRAARASLIAQIDILKDDVRMHVESGCNLSRHI